MLKLKDKIGERLAGICAIQFCSWILYTMSIFLRIKRPNTDCPSQICEAQNLIKRPKADLQSIQFKYIGSQTSNCSLIGKIDKVYTSSEKLCKIICNTSDATVVGENQTVKCQIKVNNLKRPAITAEIFNDFNNLNIDSSKVSIGPNPPKIFKIIELTPESTNESNVLPKLTETNHSNDDIHQTNFIYDIYKMISPSSSSSSLSDPKCLSLEQTIWCTNDQLIRNADNYIHDEYSWGLNEDSYDYTNVDDDDEDDSNSESNWRNDYPDEQDSSSNSSSNHSNSPYSSSNSSCNNEDSDYYY
ncbi:hypothetical protein MS3_00008837 [Schistosoma haematobium]|uniref:Uncharacterized protein n=1 Tax=Schistosoma haematobium TaxID=6185 RepID=A0A6A5DLT0_SCHHA|nr:hypothetical protein MS3_00008837 [Schistosoma haematobium]KAH9581815.1 hypothetical protein MS3_00008837 [Schistosoma haematobium]CAH8613121.1 unnamed protein product [Schistosoma haematobium]